MRFEILGPLRVSAHGQEVTGMAPRERALLAMLVLHANRTIPVTDLVDVVWGHQAPRSARAQLQGCVFRLRRQVGADSSNGQIIVTEPGGYRLRTATEAIDLLEFRALAAAARAAAQQGRREEARAGYRTALGLWRGNALADIDRDAIRQRAAGLDEERARALEERIDIELALGAGAELVGELTDLVHQYRYRERLHSALMIALCQADRQADALTAYQRIRRTLVTELGQEPGTALRELHQRVLAGDPTLRPSVPAAVTGGNHAAPPPPTNQCLPRTVADFTGREADLAWLVAAAEQADPYAPLVLAIDGMPGVGKTSLAVRAAHLLASRYPDGQLFLDLHGHSEHRPVAPAAALDALLRQLGVPSASIPAELGERSARWRAELATRRVLVLLDNAATTAQVGPLLPTSAGCLALVTSRRRLIDLDGALPRSVETLGADDAVALLARIAGHRVEREPEAAAEVAERCGYLPLALRLAAARLAHRPGWRVQDLADRLGDPATPLAELIAGDRTVADAFALSYTHLSPTAQRLFRLLGLHPGAHFEVHCAAALADETLEDAQRLLDELIDSHLVEEPNAHRYRLHDLVKAYAAELSAHGPEVERRAAVQRLLDYYLHAVAAATEHLESPASRRTFQPGPASRPDLLREYGGGGLAWLDGMRSDLVAAIRLASQLRFDRYVWQIARAMWQFLLLRGQMDDLVVTHRQGLAAAERSADANASAMMHNYLGSAYYRTSRYDEAIEHVRHAVAWHEKTGDLPGQALTRKNLAVICSLSGRSQEAAGQLEHALSIARRIGGPAVLARVVVNAGACQLILGRYEPALRHSRAGLLLAREADDSVILAIALGNIGSARARLGEYWPALRALTVALAAQRRLNLRYEQGETSSELGLVYRMLGRLDEALSHHQTALAIMRDVGDCQGQCAAYNEYGRTLLARGANAAALDQHQRALDGTTKIGYPLGQARALEGIGDCLRETDPESARRYWLRALRLYRELEVPEQHEVERQLDDLPVRT